MNLKEQTFFFKRLAYLLNANISLVESLIMLRTQTGVKKHNAIFDLVLRDIEEGHALSEAFGKFPRMFSKFCVSLIRVGESSGTLPATLEYLAVELQKKHALRSKIISAFIYPAIIALATLGITVFLMLFLFPKITPIFKSLHAHLPLSTRIVMASSALLLHYWFLLLAGIALVCIGGWYFYTRSMRLRMAVERISLYIPAFGTMLKSYHVSNASRTLGLLLTSGATLEEAVVVTAEATPNLIYQRELQALGAVVARGERISTHLATRERYFPALFCHMAAVGERSGTLPETLLYVAELYDGEVTEYSKNISVLIEPVLMVCMGLLVGFIAVSIIAPIYGITQNLHA